MNLIFRFLALSIVVVALGACGSEAVESSTPATNLAVGPLGPRNDAVIAAVGTEVIVFGGNDFFCGPGDDCAAPAEPPFTDGAAYDTATMAWRSIEDSPFGVDNASAVTRGSQVVAIVQCDKAPNCPVGRSMLVYDVAEEFWRQLAGVPGRGFHELVVVGETLFAISVSDEMVEPDYRYKDESDTWVALDPAPLPPVYDRFGVDFDGTLVIYGSPIEGEPAKLVASYDMAADRWTELAAAPGSGWQPFAMNGRVILNPHFGGATGGSHDLATDTWSELPDPPNSDTWDNNISGVIGEGSAVYESSHGWFLDLRTDTWVRHAPSLQGVPSNAAVTAVGESLFTFGGHFFTDDGVRIDGGATLWTPPSG